MLLHLIQILIKIELIISVLILKFIFLKMLIHPSVKQAYSQNKIPKILRMTRFQKSLKKRELNSIFQVLILGKKVCIRRGSRNLFKKPDINADIPLTLVIICKNRWVDENYNQEYSVIVTVEHTYNIDLYNQIRIKKSWTGRNYIINFQFDSFYLF